MRATSPKTTPERMASRVLRPMTCVGAEGSTCGRRAAAAERERAPSASPGAITPPTKVPCASMTSILVVVPKSITMQGKP